MKITSEGKRAFLADLQLRMQQRDWNMSNLASHTRVHQSQISRIIAGNFKNLSSNFMQICIFLELNPGRYYGGSRDDSDEEDRKRIADSAIAIWDGTHQDAGAVVSLLREVAKVRKSYKKR